jgi:hypothetical protein
MTDTAETRAMETALLLAGWPPDQQDKIIGDAFQAVMDRPLHRSRFRRSGRSVALTTCPRTHC